MSLIFMSGWETNKALDSLLWTSTNFVANSGLSTTVRRGPSYSFYFANANEYIRRVLPTTANEFYAQVCFYWLQSPSLSPGAILRVGKNGNIYFTLNVNSSGLLNIYTGDSSSLVATGSTVLQALRFYAIEVHFKCNASGTIEVKLDGVSECSWNGDTTLSLTAKSAVARMKFESGSLNVDTIGTLPNWATGGGTPIASTTHFKEGSSSCWFDGSSWYKITDANLPAGFLLKNGDTTQLGTIMYWMKSASITGSQDVLTKYDFAGSNICFEHLTNAGTFQVSWATGSAGQIVETTGTLLMTMGKWYHVAWTFNGPSKRWDLRIYDLYTNTLSVYSRNCTNSLRTNCTAPYSIAASGVGANIAQGLFVDDLLIFNSVLPDWQLDCYRSLYYDPILKDTDPYTSFQSNFTLEIASPNNKGMYVDDVIVNDSNGSVNNSWVNRAHVSILRTIGPSTSSDFTTSETVAQGGYNFVNRLPATTLNFIYSNTSGTTNTFRVYDKPLRTVDTLGVLTLSSVWRTANAGMTYNLILKAGNTTYLSSDLVAPTSPTANVNLYNVLSDVQPSMVYKIFESGTANPFSATEIDSIELGLRVK